MTERHPLTALAVAVALGVALASCASEPKSPAEQRTERVRARIEATFSRSQATCIMKVLDAPTLAALDRTAAIDDGSEAMRIYTNAVVACTA